MPSPGRGLHHLQREAPLCPIPCLVGEASESEAGPAAAPQEITLDSLLDHWPASLPPGWRTSLIITSFAKYLSFLKVDPGCDLAGRLVAA